MMIWVKRGLPPKTTRPSVCRIPVFSSFYIFFSSFNTDEEREGSISIYNSAFLSMTDPPSPCSQGSIMQLISQPSVWLHRSVYLSKHFLNKFSFVFQKRSFCFFFVLKQKVLSFILGEIPWNPFSRLDMRALFSLSHSLRKKQASFVMRRRRKKVY